MGREINELTPKTHKKLMYQYCNERWSKEHHEQEAKKCNARLEEYEREYDSYKKTGKISPKFAEILFSTYKGTISLIGSMNNYLSDSDETLRRKAKELEEKGYDLEEVYGRFQKNCCVYDNY
jgi:hypothetical protein